MRFARVVTALMLLVAPRVATAQETATEKVAAADVIRRMKELERSLALPQLVARLTGARDARRDAVVARAKDLMDRELLAMADDITRHPETGWKEERSMKILTDYLTFADSVKSFHDNAQFGGSALDVPEAQRQRTKEIRCWHCGEVFDVPVTELSAQVRCPRCKAGLGMILS